MHAVKVQGNSGAGRRRTSAAVAVLGVLALVITFFAVRYDGVKASDVRVNDGTVWVLNQSRGLMARMNVDAEEFDARLKVDGNDLDVKQAGYGVFVTGANGYQPVDTAAGVLQPLVPLPGGSAFEVGGSRVAIAHPDGRVWVLTEDEARAFTPEDVEPVLTADKGAGTAMVAVSEQGTVFALRGEELFTIAYPDGAEGPQAPQSVRLEGLSTGEGAVQLTVVGDRPVVFDAPARALRVGMKGRTVSLEDVPEKDLAAVLLQQPSAPSDRVVLSGPAGLHEVPLRGGEIRTHEAEGNGTPVQPAMVRGCAYGAWEGTNRVVRACGEGEVVSEVVAEAAPDADLSLRVNRDLVVLNDQELGLSWMVADQMQIVNDWQITQNIQTDENKEDEEETSVASIENLVVDRTQENKPPTAKPDSFGVRPGAKVVLPVLRNDTDPDGDYLTARVKGKQPGIGQVSRITGGTQLQIDVAEDAPPGEHTFTYEADDGRGGKDTAQVTLTVEQTENQGPVVSDQGVPAVKVRSGEEVTVNVLPYFQDPEGDTFYLANATVEKDNTVTFTADGRVTFRDDGTTTGEKSVELEFRDERGASGTGILQIEAVDDADVAPVTTADHVSVPVGQTVTVRPLKNDINPQGGALTLLEVTAPEGITTRTDVSAGAVQVTGDAAGSFYVEYTAVAQAQPASGLIRVDVVEPETEDLRPVAVDDLAMIVPGGDRLVDPLQNDRDPSGGVLVVRSLRVPEDSGVTATVIGHHLIKVEIDASVPQDAEPVPLEYEVANGGAAATGTVRVMPAARDTQFANPIGVDDEAIVRAGDSVVADVLANDVSPTEAELHVGEVLDSQALEGVGTAEIVDEKVRFTADPGASAGEVKIGYRVVDETGRTAEAVVRVQVVPEPSEAAPNQAPAPQHLQARTVSGREVKIPVPTSGVDPDGDSVMVTGITSPSPERGRVTQALGEWITYVPDEDAVGTDTFSYQVVDRYGAVKEATVQVGIAPVAEVNTPPVTADDAVEVLPERVIDVQVLENDTDAEGDPLSVDHSATTATTDIEVRTPPQGQSPPYVTVATPTEPGVHSITYEASDGRLQTPGSIVLNVTEDAPLRPPLARDDYVSAEAVMNPPEDGIVVDLLENDVDPDGSVTTLDVGFPQPNEAVEDLGDGRVRITPTDDMLLLPYTVTDPDGLTATGFLRVPGARLQPPTWVGGTLEVVSGEELTVDLNDRRLVKVRTGAQGVTITDPAQITANNADGAPMGKDASTVVYRSAEGFSGQDTIAVPVTDGDVGDASGATGTLMIPVLVKPTPKQEAQEKKENHPPTFQGSVLEVEAGGDPATLNLAESAKDPEGAKLVFAMGEADIPEGVSVQVDPAGQLSAQARTRAAVGATVNIPVTASDEKNEPVAASVQLRVVASRKPLITTGLDTAEIDAGDTGRIDVLANDSNPFPGGQRQVLDARITAGQGRVEVAGNQVQVSPDAEFSGILSGTYQVEDDTKDPSRVRTGQFRVTVAARPEPPSTPRIVESGDGFVTLELIAGADNGAPITSYTVTGASGTNASQTCQSTRCTIDGLKNGVPVTFTATATNRVGQSEPSAPSGEAVPDVKPERPAAPRAERGDGQLTITWQPPTNRGSAITQYQVVMVGPGGQSGTRTVDGSTTQLVWDGLTNGASYTFQVRARNSSDMWSDASPQSSPQHPAGPPKAPAGTPKAVRINDAAGGAVEVTWPAMTRAEANGEPITEYHVTASTGQSMSVPADQTRARFTGLDENRSVSFTVTGQNSVGIGQGPSPASNALVPYSKPGTVSGLKASLPDATTGEGPNGRVTLTWNPADSRGTAITLYRITWSGGTALIPGGQTSTTLTGLSNGTSYRFQIQAVNEYTSGEVSAPSTAVIPYTRPDPPSIKTSAGTCHDENTCYVSYSVIMPGSDGGVGPKTLHVMVDGKEQQFSGPTFDLDKAVGSGETTEIEAWVSNGPGLTSDHVTKSQKANTYVAADPQLEQSSWTWGNKVPDGTAGCSSNNCQYVGFTLTNLEPGKSYEVTFSNNNASDYVRFTATAGSDGTYTLQANEYFYGYTKETKNPLRVEVDGVQVGTRYMPG